MPEEEGQKQAAEQKNENVNPYLGKWGLFIIIIAQLMSALAFTVYMQFSDPTKDDAGLEEETETVGEDLTYYGKYKHTMERLSYSLPLPGGDSATMMMSLEIQLGRLPEERQSNKKISEADMKKLAEAVKMMDSEIRDRLRTQVIQQSISQLNSPGGQDKIREYVKEFVNNKLRSLKIDLEDDELPHDRVTMVLISELIIQE